MATLACQKLALHPRHAWPIPETCNLSKANGIGVGSSVQTKRGESTRHTLAYSAPTNPSSAPKPHCRMKGRDDGNQVGKSGWKNRSKNTATCPIPHNHSTSTSHTSWFASGSSTAKLMACIVSPCGFCVERTLIKQCPSDTFSSHPGGTLPKSTKSQIPLTNRVTAFRAAATHGAVGCS